MVSIYLFPFHIHIRSADILLHHKLRFFYVVLSKLSISCLMVAVKMATAALKSCQVKLSYTTYQS